MPQNPGSELKSKGAAPDRANVALYQMNGVPPPPPRSRPKVDFGVLTLGLLSLTGTLAAGARPVGVARGRL